MAQYDYLSHKFFVNFYGWVGWRAPNQGAQVIAWKKIPPNFCRKLAFWLNFKFMRRI